jgi:hypothetical protein
MHGKFRKLATSYFLNISTTMSSIEAALAAIASQKKPDYTAAAKKYGVDRSTLSRRHRGVTGSRADATNSKSLLSI